ncbi:M20/M25/M40 family metallo-hydrolase [Chromobacterium subtsugae]|uniref:M20/M25/M40 family metallo-hydrolase n=1 Tax=Chromobacterium subtsugae TaxID=251747 RepID=UPI000B289B34|nr:M20/M25/M40 family metallo-hydrolase [Chromobacterium subtsugae]
MTALFNPGSVPAQAPAPGAAIPKSRMPLYVIKVGSATLDAGSAVFGEIAALAETGCRVLVVVGGGSAIERQYAAEGLPLRYHTLANGDAVRTASREDIDLLVRTYRDQVIPSALKGFADAGLRAFAAPGHQLSLVTAQRNRPIKVQVDGKALVVREHLVGTPVDCQRALLGHLLEQYDVVCLTAPVAGADDAAAVLNTDADMLAAFLATALQADHIRFVTSTPGILRDIDDPESVVADIFPGVELDFVKGRMKQKMRAARHVIENGIADVAIVGPHSFAQAAGVTRVWPLPPPHPALASLTKAVSINSVSRDEAEIAKWLVAYCRQQGVDAHVDAAGNFVASKGNGPQHLLLLGHIDTVPGPWRPILNADGHLSARGVVDAKGSLVNFVETLLAASVPEHGRLTVVGAVEEEVSSSKGAFHIRDSLIADAVVIGEPSRADTLTLGYYGLLKIRIIASVRHAHSAGKGVVSAPDLMVETVATLRDCAARFDPEGISALISTKSWSDSNRQHAEGILNFRVSPSADLPALLAAVETCANEEVRCDIERATPGYGTTRTCELARCFGRAFASQGIAPRYVVKKGTSDMNTLATRWTGVDMVAYGPGDSALDHTDHEFVTAEEFGRAREVLDAAVAQWFAVRGGRQ